MIEYIKTNVPGLVKEKKSATIINKNKADYARVVSSRKKNKEILSMQQDIEQLKHEILLLMERIDFLEDQLGNHG